MVVVTPQIVAKATETVLLAAKLALARQNEELADVQTATLGIIRARSSPLDMPHADPDIRRHLHLWLIIMIGA